MTDDRFSSSRKYDLQKLLGPERGRRFVELQTAGKLARSPEEHLEYRELVNARARARRDAWLLERAKKLASTSEVPDMEEHEVPSSPIDAPPPEQPDDGPFAPEVSGPSPVEADDKQDDKQVASSPGVEDVAFPVAPDPPEVIAGRKAEVRGYIAEFEADWAAWIRSNGVWAPPRIVQKWLAVIGAAAAEGYGLLDHEPRKEIALGVFLAGTFVAFVPVSFLALRRWRQGGGTRVVDAPASIPARANGQEQPQA